MFMKGLSEEKFKRLMSVSTSNLVDSNVFIRSLLISVEREKFRKAFNRGGPLARQVAVVGGGRNRGRAYLSHTWWNMDAVSLNEVRNKDDMKFCWDEDDSDNREGSIDSDDDDANDDAKVKRGRSDGADSLSNHFRLFNIDGNNNNNDNSSSSNSKSTDCYNNDDECVNECSNSNAGLDVIATEWYCPFECDSGDSDEGDDVSDKGNTDRNKKSRASPTSENLTAVGSAGWKFSPVKSGTNGLNGSGHNGVESGCCRGDDENEGDEISCGELSCPPNTISRVRWFLEANETRLLRQLMSVVDFANVNHENICVLNTVILFLIFIKRRSKDGLSRVLNELRAIDEEEMGKDNAGALSASKSDYLEQFEGRVGNTTGGGIGSSFLKNFRELLFFWHEYYTHRGRDRLSLEFSSHVRFSEWIDIVSKLCSDDGSSMSLLAGPPKLPRSPYTRAAKQAKAAPYREPVWLAG